MSRQTKCISQRYTPQPLSTVHTPPTITASSINKVSSGGLLIAMGIVFGDIGTSPLYVLAAVVRGHPLTQTLLLGNLSCIIWTLTIQTTIKYVLITL